MTELTKRQLEKSCICDYNKKIIADLLDSTSTNVLDTEKIVRKIDAFLNEQGDLLFSEWDDKKVEQLFTWGSWRIAHAKKVKRVLFSLLKIAGSPLEEEDFVLDDTQRFNKYYLNFKQLQDKIDLTLGKLQSEISDSKNVATKYSNVIAAMYLSWIGLTPSEIMKLKNTDVDLKTKTVKFEDKTFSFYDYPEIANFFNFFIPARTYLILWRGSTQTRNFIESDFLMKQARAGEATEKNGIIAKTTQYAEVALEDIRYSGLLDRLFKFEQSGGIVPKEYTSTQSSHNKEILKILNLEVPNTYSFVSAIASILADYPKYKELKVQGILKSINNED